MGSERRRSRNGWRKDREEGPYRPSTPSPCLPLPGSPAPVPCALFDRRKFKDQFHLLLPASAKRPLHSQASWLNPAHHSGPDSPQSQPRACIHLPPLAPGSIPFPVTPGTPQAKPRPSAPPPASLPHPPVLISPSQQESAPKRTVWKSTDFAGRPGLTPMQTAGSSQPGPVSSANTGRGVGSGNSTCCRPHREGRAQRRGRGLRGRGLGGEPAGGSPSVIPGPSVLRDGV